jgi:hypothetical protein
MQMVFKMRNEMIDFYNSCGGQRSLDVELGPSFGHNAISLGKFKFSRGA